MTHKWFLFHSYYSIHHSLICKYLKANIGIYSCNQATEPSAIIAVEPSVNLRLKAAKWSPYDRNADCCQFSCFSNYNYNWLCGEVEAFWTIFCLLNNFLFLLIQTLLNLILIRFFDILWNRKRYRGNGILGFGHGWILNM